MIASIVVSVISCILTGIVAIITARISRKSVEREKEEEKIKTEKALEGALIIALADTSEKICYMLKGKELDGELDHTLTQLQFAKSKYNECIFRR